MGEQRTAQGGSPKTIIEETASQMAGMVMMISADCADNRGANGTWADERIFHVITDTS